MISKTLIKLAAVAAVTASTQATPIFLGTVDDGVSPSVANEVGWVNEILGKAVSGNALGTQYASTNPVGETLTRSNQADPGSHSVSTPPAGQIKTATDPSATGSGYEYIIAHYGGQSQFSAVFYLGGEGFDVPNDQGALLALLGLSAGNYNIAGKGGYSGFTVYNRTPDGGATVALVGLTVLGLGAIRRKIQD